MENLKTFEIDCSIVIDDRTFVVAEMIVPTTCNNKNNRYDICQIYEIVEEIEDGDYTNYIYKPVDYFYGASNTPKEIIQTAISYIKDYLNK